MSFNLPLEYSSFISSSSDLLNTINNSSSSSLCSNDILFFQIYFDYNYNLNNIIQIKDNILSFLTSFTSSSSSSSSSYLWNKDPLKFKIILYSNGSYGLGGLIEYGENIEDEWYIVYLLFEVSKQFPFCNISITDMDGQFLLIESASFIPDWLGPENSNNRVWIKNGKIHIIPLEEPGRTRTGSIKLENALDCLKRSQSRTSKGILKCISSRISVFPSHAIAQKHKTTCLVPLKVAQVLTINPQLISNAVESLCSTERDKFYSKTIKNMQFFGTEELVPISIEFTRGLYAQLTFFQRFRIPQKFQIAQSKMQENIEWNLQIAKGFDIGCRVSCGLELAYQLSYSKEQEFKTFSQQNDALKAAYLQKLGYDINKLNEENSHVILDDLVCMQIPLSIDDIREYCEKNDTSQGNDFSPTSPTFRSISQLFKDSQPLFEKINHIFQSNEDIPIKIASINDSESDDWLHLTPEEFEKNLEERIARINQLEQEQLEQQKLQQQQQVDSSSLLSTNLSSTKILSSPSTINTKITTTSTTIDQTQTQIKQEISSIEQSKPSSPIHTPSFSSNSLPTPIKTSTKVSTTVSTPIEIVPSKQSQVESLSTKIETTKSDVMDVKSTQRKPVNTLYNKPPPSIQVPQTKPSIATSISTPIPKLSDNDNSDKSVSGYDSDDDSMISNIWKYKPEDNDNESVTNKDNDSFKKNANNNNNNSNADVDDVEKIEEKKNIKILKSIVSGMDAFMNTYSDYSGVDDSSSKSNGHNNNNDNNKEKDIDDVNISSLSLNEKNNDNNHKDKDSVTKGLVFDPNRLLSLLSPNSNSNIKKDEKKNTSTITRPLLDQPNFKSSDTDLRKSEILRSQSFEPQFTKPTLVTPHSASSQNRNNNNNNNNISNSNDEFDLSTKYNSINTPQVKLSSSIKSPNSIQTPIQPHKISVTFDTDTSVLTGVAFAVTPPHPYRTPTNHSKLPSKATPYSFKSFSDDAEDDNNNNQQQQQQQQQEREYSDDVNHEEYDFIGTLDENNNHFNEDDDENFGSQIDSDDEIEDDEDDDDDDNEDNDEDYMFDNNNHNNEGDLEIEEEEGKNVEFMKEYMDVLDMELSQSTLIESFERYDDTLADVDIEKNLLTNLLESHASQMGSSGPASNLLSQIGIKLPFPSQSTNSSQSSSKSPQKQKHHQ